MDDGQNSGQVDGVEISIGRTPGKKKSREDFIQEQLESHIKGLNDLRGLEIVEVKGYVYRQTLGNGRSALPPVDEFLDDEQLGLLYGPGLYQIAYRWIDESGQPKIKTVKYSIGREFAERHRQAAADENRECYLRNDSAVPGIPAQSQNSGMLDFLNTEKIAAISALMAALRQMFPQNSGSNDLKTIIETQSKIIQSIIPSQQRQASPQMDLFGMMLPKMMERVFEPPKSEISGILQNLEALKSIKDIFGGDVGNDDREGGMVGLIERFLPMLPAFLEKFKGDERQAGAELKKNALVKFYLNNPEAQKAFYSSVSREYGQERAARLAEGLGLPPLMQSQPQAASAATTSKKPGIVQF